MRRAATVFALCLLATAPVAAGPWGQDKGHFYGKLATSSLVTTTLATPDGNDVSVPEITIRQTDVYTEYGLGAGLTAIGMLPIYRFSRIADFGEASGVGDVSLALQWGLAGLGAWRMSVRAEVQAPTGDETRGEGLLPAGSGVWEGEGVVSLGRTLARDRLWTYAEGGHLVRGGGFRDSFTWRTELGVTLTTRLAVAGTFAGVRPYGQATVGLGNASSLGDGVQFTTWGAKAFVKLGRGIAIEGGWEDASAGRNLAIGSTVVGGISWRR